MKKVSILLLCVLLPLFPIGAKKKARNSEIPILAWYSIPGGKYATVEHYQELKDCGFTYSFAHIYKYEDAIQALDLCAKVGLKSIFMCPELEKEPEEIVRKVMNHPGLGGYFLRDEPGNNAMDDLGEWARRIQKVDHKHPCYLNLLPVHGLPEGTYGEHLRLFDEKVPLPQLSYDHYPVNVNEKGETYLNPFFYQNLEMVSAEGKRVGKPFWAFALSTAHGSYPIPTIDHLRLQMYSNLAYGAQLLQYFTYWNPGTETWDFHQAPVTQQGLRSTVYDLVREFNQEIQRRAFVWKGCRMESVYHLGESIPKGTTLLTTLPQHFRQLSLNKGSILVSTLVNGDKHYVQIVNTSPAHPAQFQLLTDDEVKLVRRDASMQKASLYEPLHILAPGDTEIYTY